MADGCHPRIWTQAEKQRQCGLIMANRKGNQVVRNSTRFVYAVALMAGCLLSNQALANGSDLLKDCRVAQKLIRTGNSQGGDLLAGRCIGYAQGSAQVLNIISDHVDPLARVCLPQKLSQAQMVEALVTYLETHPQQLIHPEPVLVITAFREAFPCPVK
ncbi:Rap1a/Tai family immunity protein [Pseudomonas putida]|uniref:Rap1a/Tai family immunity protein n=1 Tax=Pseudomonas putida TaxID=303 RepID=UPI0034DAEC92